MIAFGMMLAQRIATFVVAGITTEELSFCGGMALMVLGLVLRWRLPHQQLTAEERAKDGRWTEKQVRRRVMLFRFGGPIAVTLGIVLFGVGLWE